MKKCTLIGLLIIVFMSSCFTSKNGLTSKHKKKTIKLKPVSNQIKIGYETKKAIVYVGQDDAIFLAEKLLSNKKLNKYDEIAIDDLTHNIDTLKIIHKNYIVQDWKAKQSNFNINDYNFAGFIDQWVLRKLILKRKAEVFNKTTNEFEKSIIYHFVKDKLGNQQCYYTFIDGTKFHRQLIALGE